MEIKPIRTKRDYEAALKEIERLMGAIMSIALPPGGADRSEVYGKLQMRVGQIKNRQDSFRCAMTRATWPAARSADLSTSHCHTSTVFHPSFRNSARFRVSLSILARNFATQNARRVRGSVASRQLR